MPFLAPASMLHVPLQLHTSTLTYSSIGDTNGAAYLLGTNFGAVAWTNPHTAGRMNVTRSSALEGTGADLVNRALEYTTTDNGAGEWIKFDFGLRRALVLSKYTIANFADNPTQLTRNWKIQGSNNGSSWTDLDTRVADATVVSPDFHGAFDVTPTVAYRWLRLLNTGANLAGLNFIQICEMEFYGDFSWIV